MRRGDRLSVTIAVVARHVSSRRASDRCEGCGRRAMTAAFRVYFPSSSVLLTFGYGLVFVTGQETVSRG